MGDQMDGKYALGIDFGGTKVLAAVVALDTGQVVGSAKKKTRADDGPAELLNRIFDVSDAAITDANRKKRTTAIVGIGVGIAGQVDADQGILLGTPNLSQATVDLPLAEELSKRFSVPCALRNDVQIAALGEQHFGAGRGCDDFLCVFVGTGVGGALVQSGSLLRGSSGTAGEIGHLVIHADGRLCGCGGRGHLEAYASRTAITRWILGELRRGRGSQLSATVDLTRGEAPGGTAIRSGVLARAVGNGDQLAIEAIRDAGRFLGIGLASVINFVNPSRIILGGGVIEAVDLLLDVATDAARREALPVPGSAVEVVKAGLGDNAGVVGAAILGSRAA
jgi:glucokinase